LLWHFLLPFTLRILLPWPQNAEVVTNLAHEQIGYFSVPWDRRGLLIRRIPVDRMSPALA
jgi:hypothetical protein